MKALYDATRFTSATPNTTIAPFESEPVIANFAESAPSGPANRRSPEPDGTPALVIGAGPLTRTLLSPQVAVIVTVAARKPVHTRRLMEAPPSRPPTL